MYRPGVRSFAILLVALAACGSGAPPCGPRPGVVACVDDTAITAATAREHLRPAEPMPGHVQAADPAVTAVDAAIRVQLFAAEARRRGLARGERRAAVLNQALIADERTRAHARPEDVTDLDADALLARAPGRVSKVERLRVRGIYLADAAAAEALYPTAAQADDAAFAALATARSVDPATAAVGGDLGEIDDAHSPLELERAATALRETGQVVGPVALADGRFLILRATSVEAHADPVEVARPRAREYLAHQAELRALDALAAELEARHRVRRFPAAFAEVTAAPAVDGGR